MSAETIVRDLIAVPGVTALIGTRCAMVQLPQGVIYPALVYETITDVPQDPIGAADRDVMMRARVQITAFARTLPEVIAVHDAVRAALEYRYGEVGGERIVSVTRAVLGPYERDQTAQLFARPVDYIVVYYSA